MAGRFLQDAKPGPAPGFFLLWLLAGCGPPAAPAAAEPEDHRASASRDVRVSIAGQFEDGNISEASGIAASRRSGDVLWVHNDSGSKARLYAVDTSGRSRGRIRLEKADNDDWEDLASGLLDGEAVLIVGDIGDNDARRKHVTLYVVADPDLDDDDKPELRPLRRIRFRYPDGPRDAEALAFDSARDRALILTKRDVPPRLYAVPLTEGEDETIEAQALGAVTTLPRPSRQDVEIARTLDSWHWQPTAMDIAPDGSAIVILTYSAVYYYQRQGDEDWTQTLARRPLALDTRRIRDAEAIAFGSDTRTLFMTVEKRHAPLVRIDIIGDDQ